MRSLASGFADAWLRFWFTPTSLATYAAMRTVLGVSVVGWALSILPDLRTFYFDDGLLQEPDYAPYRLGLFQWFTSDTAVVVVWVVLLVSGAALASGQRVRIAAPLMWLAMLSMQQGAPSALNAGDLLLRIWGAYFAFFALVTPGRFLDTPLLGIRGDDGSRQWMTGPSWLIRLAQLQLTVVYPATIIAKLDGDTWREGTAALYAIGLVDFERFWLPDFVRENLLLGNLMTWFTVAVEISLPFLLWTRRTRWVGIGAGLVMHLGFDYTMRLGFFLPAMLVGYLAFVRPSEVEWGLTRVMRRARRDARDQPELATEDRSATMV
ncbi:MAG: HTTM domain-containing protein [Actinomycetota bacterium]